MAHIKQPMLCARTTFDDIEQCLKDVEYLIALPKLDGIRCLVVNRQPVTRKFKPFPNVFVHDYLAKTYFDGLDGEIVIGGGKKQFIANTEGLMRRTGRPDFVYHIFDMHNNDLWFQRRLYLLRYIKDRRIRIVPHKLIRTAEELQAYEDECLELGYEGVIVRHPRQPYKFGRSTIAEMGMMKLKRFEDSEAVIKEVFPLMHNSNPQERNELGKAKRSSAKAGMIEQAFLGTMTCYDTEHNWTFNVGMGPGLTMAERKRLWKIRQSLPGQTIKYEYLPMGTKDRPRHPKYLGMRYD